MCWIQTFTGRKFYPLAPHEDDVDILDIAHALALKCRYSGHCREFFSVAQHSVMVSLMVPYSDSALWGLLHDAGEAYLPDVARPIKGYTNIGPMETRVMLAVANKFQLPQKPPCVASADLCCLERERRQLMPNPPEEWATARWWDGDCEPFECWSWQHSEQMFLERFKEITQATFMRN